MSDTLQLHGMVFYAYHGYIPAEQELGQRFVIDVDVMGDFAAAAADDAMEEAIDYGEVYALVKDIVEGQRCRLIETLAERIAGAILSQFAAAAVTVQVRKPQAPLRGHMDYVGVRLTRRAGD